MDERCQLICQNFFFLIDPSVFPVFHLFNFRKRKECQHSQTSHHVIIADISPVLVKFKRRRFFRIQPDSSVCRLAHLFAFAVHQQSNRHCIGIFSCLSADQIRSRQHIAPLVVAAELHVAAVMIVQIKKIIGLHNHIIKFKKAQPLFHPLFVTFRTQHVVDRKTHSYIPQQFYIF